MYKFQLSLFYDLQYLIQTSSFYRKYYLLFSALDLSSIPDINANVGRTGYSRHAMLRAFINKHQERIKTIPDLLRFLDSHPALTEMCGFIASVLWLRNLALRVLHKPVHQRLRFRRGIDSGEIDDLRRIQFSVQLLYLIGGPACMNRLAAALHVLEQIKIVNMCAPTCTRPITGTRVPRNQSQPTVRYLRRRANQNTATDTASNSRADAATCHTGSLPKGCG